MLLRKNHDKVIKRYKRGIAALTVLLMLCHATLFTAATGFPESSGESVKAALTDTAEFLLKTVPKPQVSSTMGEWAVIGLARSGCSVPDDYFSDYYSVVEKAVTDTKGILHDRKYTENSRVVLALTAIGKNPAAVAGYNLLEPLADFEKTVWQGINGPIFALLALDAGNYEIPPNQSAKVQATREMYVDEILSRQLADGGFALTGDAADPDITGMALQALSKYQSRTTVKLATEAALTCLSKIQDTNGGFTSDIGGKSLESTAQVVVALCELGLDVQDPRFVKNGKTVADDLLSFYTPGKGFRHIEGGGGMSGMSTEQGLYALVSLHRRAEGSAGLYRMTDADPFRQPNSNQNTSAGLPGKNKDVAAMPVKQAGRTFADIAGHEFRHEIEALASREIINGMTDTTFEPGRTMTRAQFATIVTKGLGLAPKANGKFTDVPPSEWYAAYVGTANSYGIVNGISSSAFDPERTITRQEAAVMIANAAKLCGLDTQMGEVETRNMLAQFVDYTQTADWARPAMAFCYKAGILDQSELNVEPLREVSRGEIAKMVCEMLNAAKLML